jgi:SAM-dependent methyltransferase
VTILALDPNRRTNAQAIRDAHELGYIRGSDYVLDVTYNTGKFWRQWQPKGLVTNDLDPRFGLFGDDWRSLHWQDDTFDVVVFDPDYKLQGTSSNQGPASSNAAYGMDREYRPVETQMALIINGLSECIRVCKPGGRILFKTMDQVVSGEKNWLVKDFWLLMRGKDCRLVDEIHVFGHRPQPKDRKCSECQGQGFLPPVSTPVGPVGFECSYCGGAGRFPIRQVHTHGSFSTLMIFEKGKS